MTFLRYPTTFESSDGQTVATFPKASMEWQPSRALRKGNAVFIGQSGGLNLTGFGPPPKAIATEAIRFDVAGTVSATVDATFDTFAVNAYLIGTGKLYVTNSDGTRRWCYASLAGMPSKIRSADKPNVLSVDCQFDRYTDWMDTALTSGSSANIGSSPSTFTITNPGSLNAVALVITLRALGAAGITDPAIANTTLGCSLSTTRDSASTSSRIKVTPARNAVEYSNDAGVTYAADYDKVTVPATQAVLFELGPGANSITVTCSGTPNYVVDYQFYPAYEV